AIAYPMLDQTRRYRFLPVRAYCYTESNPGSHHQLAGEQEALSSPRQRECAQIVLAKPALPRIDETRDEPADPPHSPPADAPRGSPWTAARLAQAAPSLLQAFPAGALDRLDPQLLWDWWQWLDRHRGARVLAIGADAHIDALATLAQASGATLRRLRGGTGDGAAPWTEVGFDVHTARLPDPAALDGERFDAV